MKFGPEFVSVLTSNVLIYSEVMKYYRTALILNVLYWHSWKKINVVVPP